MSTGSRELKKQTRPGGQGEDRRAGALALGQSWNAAGRLVVAMATDTFARHVEADSLDLDQSRLSHHRLVVAMTAGSQLGNMASAGRRRLPLFLLWNIAGL